MELYGFFNSSTSWRVRIALNLKGIRAGHRPVNIRQGMHHDAAYVAEVNPAACVPGLVDGDFSLGQSLAIIDWLETAHPEPRLVPPDPRLRARVLEFSFLVACDLHPLNNLRVLKYLSGVLGVDERQKDAWYQHWSGEGFRAAERLLERARRTHGGPWCFGASPTLADVCLVPQYLNARRFGHDVSAYPLLGSVVAHAATVPAFVQAEPRHQPDYVPPA